MTESKEILQLFSTHGMEKEPKLTEESRVLNNNPLYATIAALGLYTGLRGIYANDELLGKN